MSSFWHWQVKGFASNRTALKGDGNRTGLLQDRKLYCLQARPSIFQPEIVQAGAVKGLKQTLCTDGSEGVKTNTMY